MSEYSGSSPMGDGRNVAGSKYSGDAKQGKVELNKEEFNKVLKMDGTEKLVTELTKDVNET